LAPFGKQRCHHRSEDSEDGIRDWSIPVIVFCIVQEHYKIPQDGVPGYPLKACRIFFDNGPLKNNRWQTLKAPITLCFLNCWSANHCKEEWRRKGFRKMMIRKCGIFWCALDGVPSRYAHTSFKPALTVWKLSASLSETYPQCPGGLSA